ncbi:methylenetetrahydrofolate reductase [Saccharospirillum salsuginis]|uniref:Methylenetetrahydrofolate reductase n=1 Tax=Saccharospirillum salsuginis TaxID=418750 RepID=A0A918K3V0_9GAMM|nr:methylenetetrahydrofolate reductase [Saccharospirillum salsuginis]GGX42661.1 methylenetetrahydrofolate reductase [Saccharospirillum salsuginis]
MLHSEPANGRPGDTTAGALNRLIQGASLEATPRQILGTPSLSTMLPRGLSVYVPFLPKAEFSETLAACHRLLAEGFVPIPHLPARAVSSMAQLDGWLSDLAGSGVHRLLLIAGDTGKSLGPFADTLAVLASGALLRHGFRNIGIAGHPDGHPVASPVELKRALAVKQDYARQTDSRLWIVTQFTFEAERVLSWLNDNATDLHPWPVYVGLPGPSGLKTLLAYAAQCGVGTSAKQVLKRPGTTRLLRAWTPDGVVDNLAHYRARHPDSPLAGLHLFPFGGLQKTAQWLHSRRLEADPAGDNDSLNRTQETGP